MLQGATLSFRGLVTVSAVGLIGCSPGVMGQLDGAGPRLSSQESTGWRLGAGNVTGRLGAGAVARALARKRPQANRKPRAAEPAPDDGGEITMEPLELRPAPRPRESADTGRQTHRRRGDRRGVKLARHRNAPIYGELSAAETSADVEPAAEIEPAVAIPEIDPWPDVEGRSEQRRRGSTAIVEGFHDEDGFTPISKPKSTYARRLRDLEKAQAPRRISGSRLGRSDRSTARTPARARPMRPAVRKESPPRLPPVKVDERGQVIDDEDPL